MKAFVFVLLLIGVLMIHVTARAEGVCPPGMVPYSNAGIKSCGPIPGYDQKQSSQIPATPTPRWESRWGAIYTDANKGVVGLSSGKYRRNEARAAAFEDCTKRGGTQCKYAVSYSNGCGAMVSGDNWFNVESGATEDEAIQAGMKACKKDNDTNCRVYLTTCSPAVRVQ